MKVKKRPNMSSDNVAVKDFIVFHSMEIDGMPRGNWKQFRFSAPLKISVYESTYIQHPALAHPM